MAARPGLCYSNFDSILLLEVAEMATLEQVLQTAKREVEERRRVYVNRYNVTMGDSAACEGARRAVLDAQDFVDRLEMLGGEK